MDLTDATEPAVVGGTRGRAAAAPGEGYDVFLSYSRTDADAVLRIAEELTRAGLRPWLDVWNTTGGRPWPEELAEGLAASRSCAVFVGPGDGEAARPGGTSSLSDWEREELRVAVDRAAKDPSFRVFLVLLHGVAQPFDASGLLPFLSMRTWVDMRRGNAHPGALQHLMHAVRGVPFGPETPVDLSDDVCPYQGLSVFEESDARFFFGRDAEIQRIVEKLKASPFVAVFGPSGSGKSSLVRAGVLPQIRAGAVPDSQDWDIRTFTPGARPLETLASHLNRLDPDLPAPRIRDDLMADPRTLRMLTAGRGRRLLLVVDQFEELVTLSVDPDERRRFVGNLLEAVVGQTGCSVIITVRADFYPQFAQHPALAQHIAEHQFLVGPMGPESLRQVVEAPARLVGLRFEPGLVDTILEDVGEDAGALPLLEHALLETWQRRLGDTMTLEGYQEAGGVAGALAKRADTTWESLGAAQQEAVRRMLLRLTRPGEGAEDTRQRAYFEELVPSGADEDTVRSVVEQLADARLLAVNVDLRTERVLVDVTHEALIRAWPRLRGWIDENREGLRTHQRLTQAAREWSELERDDSVLYRGARLAAAREWAQGTDPQLNELERAFLDASMAAEEEEVEEEKRRADRERQRAEREARAARRFRKLAVGLGVLLVVAVAATALAIQLRARAQTEARRNAADALAERALGTVGVQPEAALLLALEALEMDDSASVRSSFLRTIIATARIDTFLHGHDGNVWSAELGPVHYRREGAGVVPDTDGSVVLAASGGEDGTVRWWDVEAGAPLGEPLRAHEGEVFGVAISPDGRTMASGGEDDRINLWDVGSREQLLPPLTGHTGDILTVDFRPPDGRMLVSTSTDGTVRMWNAGTGEQLWSAAPVPGEAPDGAPDAQKWQHVRDAAFSADGTRLVTGHGDGTIQLWDPADGTPLSEPVEAHERPVANVEFAAGGEVLVTVSRDDAVKFWDVSGNRPSLVAARFDHDGDVHTVATTTDGTIVATGGLEGDIRLWDPTTAEPVGESLRGHDNVLTLHFDPDGRMLSAGAGGALVTWEATADVPPLLGERIDGRRLTAAAGALVAGHPDGRVTWHDPETMEEQASDTPADGLVTALAARHPDTDPVLAEDVVAEAAGTVAVGYRQASSDSEEEPAAGTVVVYNGPGEPVASFPHPADVTALVFSPVAPTVISAARDGVVRVWDLQRGELLTEFAHGDDVWGLSVSPDGRWVAAAGDHAHVRLWDLRDPSEDPTLVGDTAAGHTDEVAAVAFSPDGGLLATGSYDHTVALWEIPGAGDPSVAPLPVRPRQLLRSAEARVTAVAFSPDGATVLAATEQGRVLLWDVASGRLLGHLTDGHGGWTWSLGVAPSGHPLSASDDGSAVRWNDQLLSGTLDDWRAHVCSVAGRSLSPDEWELFGVPRSYAPSCAAASERGLG